MENMRLNVLINMKFEIEKLRANTIIVVRILKHTIGLVCITFH